MGKEPGVGVSLIEAGADANFKEGVMLRFNSNPHSTIYETSDGVFVLYDEYKELQAERDQLSSDLAKCHEAKAAYGDEIMRLRDRINELEDK